MDALKAYLEQFAALPDTAWTGIQEIFSPATLQKGDVFAREGELCSRFAFLDSGVLRAFYRQEDGTEFNKHFFTAPAMIGGYGSLVSGKPNPFIQEALSPCRIRVAAYADLLDLYDRFPALQRIGRHFAERYFVEKEQKELEAALYDSAQRYRLFQQRYPGLEQQVAQYHVASYLGITPTQLSRIRRKA
ncbi:MAG: Crp/Fnr family transcriptional regulator [Mucilaginibacter polytrichastri]|nr:Crp/Fnr family transcriptional regulator [Mucilaginibacter polytrichastri]